MAEIGKGRFDHRIAEQRNDEFGLLFRAFDDMAQALQRREPGTPAAPPTLLPGSAAAQGTSGTAAGQAGARR
jgi:serine/threonine-protein kinase